ncbi:glycine--tRNA ligase subunit beta [secondary endosymbiont of Ctenarytaina eucalypti]|uniref:Glycine--tRNA ligase beta subunit n=1 Tax=secondary endosymbiont of Ctenarytaina eucalypti TaxID=1199245 RepID=J3TX34_9ENTR|nr:glycine--tRNA ligase subunit beta [secondary endosymbiont of Ctenarytaina eucalypti]AFP84645.1 glycyl-tRNA synthetase beta chain [secondary endosymbiont of Ctenarytaina eucalypti]
MTQHTFLVEIGTEELPPKSLRALAEGFAANISLALHAASILHGKVSWFASPRRLAVKVAELAGNQEDDCFERRGPAISKAFDSNLKPTKEAEGWARSCGIKVSQAEYLTTAKGEWLLYRRQVNGQPVQGLLCDMVISALGKLTSSQMMSWGDNNTQFIRPVHTVTMLLDDALIPGIVLGIKADRMLRGHPFMGEREIILEHADQYPQLLLKHGRVMASYFQRKEIIRRDVDAAAKRLGGWADLSDSLLEEVTSLVEWPVVLTGCFEEKFLAVSTEALVCTMKGDQKYFPVYDAKGNLLPHFIFVANIDSKDPQQIISGNEKVMRPRLADAEFFFNTDRKQRLEDRLPALETMLFQKQLGTLREKSDRIAALAAWIAVRIGANAPQAARAGLLSKCDLMTNMVFEFTDIQGVMGMHYAIHDGEPEAVALAQKEQYQPRFSGDSLPTTLVSCAVASADKMDTLAGIFGINQHPRGAQDPFALRRAALGVLRIFVEKQLPIDLKTLTEEAVRLYGDKILNHCVVENVIDFMLGRCCAWYEEKGYRGDAIQAVLVRRPTCPVDFDARIRAVSYFLTLSNAAGLAAANKRVSNILAKSNNSPQDNFQESLLKDPAEIRLASYVVALGKKLKPMLEAGHYQEALVALSELRGPVDAFFDSVMVMTDDHRLRVNRLNLLSQLQALFLQVADISLLR